jgi:predicted dehydrogenase
MMFLSRREFLNDSALFAAAAAAFAGDNLLAEDAVAQKKVSANDQIRVAVIGFRGQGGGHLGAYSKMADTIVHTICDVDSSLADKGIRAVEANQKKAPKFVTDLRRIMDDKEIDAVSIATPNHWHALAAIWAIQAGKDVYVEKPVSHNVWEGRQIVNWARKEKKIVQTGTQSRSNAGMREAIEHVHTKIGQLKISRGLCYKKRDSIGKTEGPQKVPDSIDYNLWCGPAPNNPPRRNSKQYGPIHYEWHWFWDYGNGDLGNQGIHEMDKARWGLKKDALCSAVWSLGGRWGYVDDGETPNTQICFFDYGDSQLIFEVRGLQKKLTDPFGKEVAKGNYVGNIWYGTDGYVVSSSYDGAAAFTPKGELVKKFSGGGSHFANFVKAVRSRKHTDLNADIEEGHLSSALCHLGNISYRLGKKSTMSDNSIIKVPEKDDDEAIQRMWTHLKDNGVSLGGLEVTVGPKLKLDPKTERFVGNDDANKLLTRDYRKPFVVPAG